MEKKGRSMIANYKKEKLKRKVNFQITQVMVKLLKKIF